MSSIPAPAAVIAPAHRYGPVAIVFHWVLAAAILAALGVGLYMTDLPLSPQRLKLYNWHKWAGMAILVLSALRLLWRLGHRPPALPPAIERTMPAWQRAAHHATHHSLYLLFFAVPLAGWAYSSSAGFPIVWFGILPLPDFVPVDRPLSEVLKLVHRWLAYALAAGVFMHVGAAIWHHFVVRDGLLGRMWPARRG
jgi:cytochrome b561